MCEVERWEWEGGTVDNTTYGSIFQEGYYSSRRACREYEKAAIIERLFALWREHPAMRLTQLMNNAQGGGDKATLPEDTYNVEDYEFIERLEAFYASL
jgi:hypothetical protein